MHVLVTGGAGFIGSHLVDALLARGDRVTVFDSFHTGSRTNLAAHAGNPLFSLVEHDVRTPYDVDADAIVNLACPASPVHYQSDPVKTLETSVLGVMHGLALAKRRGIPFLQASTSEVYGDPSVHPQPEGYWGHVNPIGPRACYDEGKRVAETLCADYRRQYGVDTKLVRIFNTYGPRMAVDDGRVVSNFVVQALRGEPITLYGDGTQTRSFCYVDDLVAGLLAMLASPKDVSGPVNLGNPREFSMFELAQQVLTKTGSKSVLRHLPLPADDPRQRRPDVSVAARLLGWSPRVHLEEGLDRTIADFKIRLSNPSVVDRPSSVA